MRHTKFYDLSDSIYVRHRVVPENLLLKGGIMGQKTPTARDNEWFDYYDHFPYFSPDTVRDGCQPRIMEHDKPTKAIVLVHGLTDSPHFMTAIGDYFFRKLGYNVYLPLLHFHGLREPKGMEGVSLTEWKANVNLAVRIASSKVDYVAIGGLSTGGTLSFYEAVNNAKVSGALYLFSAALDLAGGFVGDIKEFFLRTPLVDLLDKNKSLIGDNPYRYAGMDLDGARELSKLISETDSIIEGFSPQNPFSKRIFAAHSESDSTASIKGIEALEEVSAPNKFQFFRIPKVAEVSHASLVLQYPIYPTATPNPGEPLEKANPLFDEMMKAISDFENRQRSLKNSDSEILSRVGPS